MAPGSMQDCVRGDTFYITSRMRSDQEASKPTTAAAKGYTRSVLQHYSCTHEDEGVLVAVAADAEVGPEVARPVVELLTVESLEDEGARDDVEKEPSQQHAPGRDVESRAPLLRRRSRP